MALADEISVARKEIVSDGYDMSIGELMNLYRDGEIKIDPDFQRLFRWEITRKTRFIESILLGLPLPPIFVYQSKDSKWELIDGLQRVSTILEFSENLKDSDGNAVSPAPLEGTRFLPSLVDKKWSPTNEEAGDGIGNDLQLQIKRARMRVEILKQESDPQAKFELFQRLNTGGASLSEQEVRNCVAIMLDKTLHQWMVARANEPCFLTTINQTDVAIERQAHIELALRFFAFRNVNYTNGLDVHEYLDDALFKICTDATFNRDQERGVFDRTFSALNVAMGDKSFKRWNGAAFGGKFLMSVFEVVALGVSKNIDAIDAMGAHGSQFIVEKCKALWGNGNFNQYSGAGVRGTTRLSKLLPMANGFFAP
jgi:uncharacterized protein DUF262